MRLNALSLILHRFKHKNPEDPTEVPGGFVTDCKQVNMNQLFEIAKCTVIQILSLYKVLWAPK